MRVSLRARNSFVVRGASEVKIWDLYTRALFKAAERNKVSEMSDRDRRMWYWPPFEAYKAGYRAGRRAASVRNEGPTK